MKKIIEHGMHQSLALRQIVFPKEFTIGCIERVHVTFLFSVVIEKYLPHNINDTIIISQGKIGSYPLQYYIFKLVVKGVSQRFTMPKMCEPCVNFLYHDNITFCTSKEIPSWFLYLIKTI